MYRIGVPLPESALTGQTDGGELVRHIRMGKGIQFDQVATDWEGAATCAGSIASRRIRSRRARSTTTCGSAASTSTSSIPNTRCSPGHDGTTSLRVAMSYRVSTRFNWYAGRVAELFVGNFEETALRFYARRAEAQAARNRATSSFPTPLNP